MIYTNEPANVFYVVLSAHRGGLHPLDNASRHRRLVNSCAMHRVFMAS